MAEETTVETTTATGLMLEPEIIEVTLPLEGDIPVGKRHHQQQQQYCQKKNTKFSE